MAKKFYDTCALLNELHHAFNDGDFFISIITLKELENIKTSTTKDQDTKFRARRLLRLLEENEDKYTIIYIDKEQYEENIKYFDFLPDSNDSKIIISAYLASLKNDIIFITNDLACKQLAKSVGLKCEYIYLILNLIIVDIKLLHIKMMKSYLKYILIYIIQIMCGTYL